MLLLLFANQRKAHSTINAVKRNASIGQAKHENTSCDGIIEYGFSDKVIFRLRVEADELSADW